MNRLVLSLISAAILLGCGATRAENTQRNGMSKQPQASTRKKASRKSAALAPKIRFVKYEGKLAYGLTLTPPWKDGGKLVINLPEHLSYQGTRGILRHNDKKPNGQWVVSDGGLSANLDVESSTLAGAWVKGRAKAIGGGRVELSLTIVNKSRLDMTWIGPLYCHHYKDLTGFPRWIGNYKHTYVMTDGKVTALADIKTAKADTQVKGAIVRGCTQTGAGFAKKHGGFIDSGIDAAISGVTSLDGKRNMVIAWTPGKSLLSNRSIPCLHTDPYYAPIKRGTSRTAKGVILFTEKPVAEAFKQLKAEGLGLAASK